MKIKLLLSISLSLLMFASNAYSSNIIRVPSYSSSKVTEVCVAVGSVIGSACLPESYDSSYFYDHLFLGGMLGAVGGFYTAILCRMLFSTPQEILEAACYYIDYVEGGVLGSDLDFSDSESFLKKIDLLYIQSDWPRIDAVNDLDRLYETTLYAKESLEEALKSALVFSKNNVSGICDEIRSALQKARELSSAIANKIYIIKKSPDYAKMRSKYRKTFFWNRHTVQLVYTPKSIGEFNIENHFV